MLSYRTVQAAVLTTMDIVHDGFGLMLALGDLAWVPFLYSLQARFALEHREDWSLVFLIGILALNCEFVLVHFPILCA